MINGFIEKPTVEKDVYYAYRLLLGREPDEEGFRNHVTSMRSRRLSATDLAREFLESSEFRGRGGGARYGEIALDGYFLYFDEGDHDVGQTVASMSYEPHVTHFLKGMLKPRDYFVDVGANIGYFSALAAHIVGSKGRVFAVEPMDKNLQLVYRTIWKNGFDQIEVFPFAASSENYIIPMATGPHTSNGEIIGLESTRPPSLFVQSRRLDDLLVGVSRLDVVKIDIEGYEPHAWRGFSTVLMAFKPAVFTEFHPMCLRKNGGTAPEEYLQTLFEYGDVEVLLPSKSQMSCASAAEVMTHWASTDFRHGGEGKAHLDLLVKPRT